MNWKEYTEKALQTSTHATREKRITCCLLGLLGEVIEFSDKAELLASNNKEYTPRDDNELKKEMGDAYWYLSILCYDIGHTPVVVEMDYREGLVHNIAYLQEYMKKDYRDFDYSINEKYKEKIHEQINIIYTKLLDITKDMEWAISEILEMNIEKLFSRKERNQLKGEGDNR